MNIERDLQQLQNIRPSKKLAYRIESLAHSLPERSGVNMPLVAFRLALAVGIFFIITSMGTGVLLAAKGSNKGSVLYPIRQTLERHNVPFFAPTTTPTPTQIPQIRSSEKNEQTNEPHESEGKQATNAAVQDVHHSIKGVGDEGDDRENEKELEGHILIPTQEVKGLHIGPKREDD